VNSIRYYKNVPLLCTGLIAFALHNQALAQTSATGGPTWSGSYSTSKSIDGDLGTYFAGDPGVTSWTVTYDLGSSGRIDSLIIDYFPRTSTAAYVPQSNLVAVSQNGSSFTTVTTLSDNQSDVRTVSVNATARYVRFTMNGKSSLGNRQPAIREVAFERRNSLIDYESSHEALTLKAEVSYNANGTKKPLVVIMHGWAGGMSNTRPVAGVAADEGLFALNVAMRARDGSDGEEDAGRLEIHDIYDAVQHALDTYGSEIQEQNINIWGYSGGGGNTFSSVVKMPDTFNRASAFFGISDYAYWIDHGSGSRAATVVDWTGGTPSAVPARYASSRSLSGVANNPWTTFHLFWDETEATNPEYFNTEWLEASDNLGYTNSDSNKSFVSDSHRWEHGYPNGTNDDLTWALTDLLIPEIQTAPLEVITIPDANAPEFTVLGFLLTRKFRIYLGDAASAVARVRYSRIGNSVRFAFEKEVSESSTAEASLWLKRNGLSVAGVTGGTYNSSNDRVEDIDLDGTVMMYLGALPHTPTEASGGPSWSNSYLPSKSIDGDPETYFAGDPSVSSWTIKYKLASPSALNRLVLQYVPRHASASYVPTTNLIQYSSDDVSYTTVTTLTENGSDTRTVTLNATARYVKFTMQGKSALGNRQPAIQDVVFE
jgi:dienelactone hydrolase